VSGEPRHGGRSARVRAAVLEATSAVLAEDGYEGLTIETVAGRAGVHKTTVYRRWPTRAQLVADALRERAEQNVPVPDTGTFAGDLEALAISVVRNIGSRAGTATTRTMVAAGLAAPDVADVGAEFWSDRLARTGVIVERAIARGEVPAGTDPHLVIETLIGPLYVRLLLTGEPIDEALGARVAALVADGARASR
jgi:AcrR family transcriptional regulator